VYIGAVIFHSKAQTLKRIKMRGGIPAGANLRMAHVNPFQAPA